MDAKNHIEDDKKKSRKERKNSTVVKGSSVGKDIFGWLIMAHQDQVIKEIEQTNKLK